MAKKIFLLFVLAVLGLVSCKTIDPATMPSHIQVGDTYYTQFSLQYEKGRYRTTNYRTGILVPINSEVRLVKIDRKRIFGTIISTGREIIIENVLKHTDEDVFQAFDKIFAKTKFDLSGFTVAERKQVMTGRVAKGMRKKAVIAAIGYPPATGTASLESDQWRYWATRWNTFIVHFENGRVSEIQS